MPKEYLRFGISRIIHDCNLRENLESGVYDVFLTEDGLRCLEELLLNNVTTSFIDNFVRKNIEILLNYFDVKEIGDTSFAKKYIYVLLKSNEEYVNGYYANQVCYRNMPFYGNDAYQYSISYREVLHGLMFNDLCVVDMLNDSEFKKSEFYLKLCAAYLCTFNKNNNKIRFVDVDADACKERVLLEINQLSNFFYSINYLKTCENIDAFNNEICLSNLGQLLKMMEGFLDYYQVGKFSNEICEKLKCYINTLKKILNIKDEKVSVFRKLFGKY